MNSIILKLESKGKVYWKTDSFWSLRENREYAKIHSEYSAERLYNSLVGLLNADFNRVAEEYNETEKEQIIKFYENSKVGYDIVKGIDIVKFDFIKNGIYEYKIKYNKEKNEFGLVDIRRKLKLEKLANIAQ